MILIILFYFIIVKMKTKVIAKWKKCFWFVHLNFFALREFHETRVILNRLHAKQSVIVSVFVRIKYCFSLPFFFLTVTDRPSFAYM